MTEVFVVSAYRWGDIGNHCYTVGVFCVVEDAIEAACFERDYRGIKYECVVRRYAVGSTYHGGLPEEVFVTIGGVY